MRRDPTAPDRPTFEALEPRLLLDAVADWYEPDDSAWYASTISVDYGQTHSFHTGDDVDWVRFDLDETSRVTVEAESWDGTPDFILYGFDGSWWSIPYSDGMVLEDGSYYLELFSSWDEPVESYEVSVWAEAWFPDWYEYDDDPWWASTISTDGYVQYHSLHDPYDVDWVTFTLDFWSDVTVTVDSFWGGPDFWLYGPDDPYDEIRYTDGMLLEPGDYWVEVADVWGDLYDDYSIDVWAEPWLPDAWENDDVAAWASDIASWGLSQTHSFHRPGDEDWTTFTLLQSANVTVETSGVVGDTELWLYGPNSAATLVGYDDAGGTGFFSKITAYALPAGAYFIRATEKHNDGLMDDYTLTVNARFTTTPAGLPVQLLRPVYGSYLANVVELQWADFDPTHSGQISVYIDADADATNGVGETLLGTWSEDPDGAGDFATVVIPATVTPRFDYYYLWARLDTTAGHSIGPVVPVRVFERVAASEDPLGDAAFGIAYELHGIEAGQLDDTIYYRVRSDYNPTVAGGDVRLAVGGVVSGIAVIAHGGVSPSPVIAGDLYGGAGFSAGTNVAGNPAIIISYVSHLPGHSSAVASACAGLAWDYELEGSVDAAVLPGYLEHDVTVSWTMAGGNDLAWVTLPFAHFKLPAGTYVRSVYEGLLRRAPDASAAGWTAALEGGALTRASVAESVILSAEFETFVASVARLYRALLGRSPDAAGLDFWVHHMHAGVPLQTVAGLFMRSPEFIAARGDVYGGTLHADFVRWHYVNVLGRVPSEAPDSNEVWPWVQALIAGVPREVVTAAFTNSAEYAGMVYPHVRAAVLGMGLLGRTPGEPELAAWVAGLHAGQTWQQFINMVLDAPEYQKTSVNACVAAGTPIARLYQAYVGHAPTYDELEYLAGVTRRGLPLATVALSIALSPDVIATYGDAYRAYSNADYVRWCYALSLGRTASAGELASWQSALDNRWLTREEMMVRFAESPESTARTGNAVTSNLVFAAIMRRMPVRTVEDVYWTGYLNAGNSLDDMMNVLLV